MPIASLEQRRFPTRDWTKPVDEVYLKNLDAMLQEMYKELEE